MVSTDDCNRWEVKANELRKGNFSEYWIEQLNKLNRPIAQELRFNLSSSTLLGVDFPKEKTKKLIRSYIECKEIHKDKVILTRVGDFYESEGVDALMLINYCGLAPMAGECRAGTPVKNVQSTLNSLTDAGLSIAVYEECNDVDAERGPSSNPRKKMKERVLSQIISPACKTYLHDLTLLPEDINYPEVIPIVACQKNAFGFDLYSIYLDEKRVRVMERLEEEVVAAMISQTGYSGVVYVDNIDISKELLFIESAKKKAFPGYTKEHFITNLLREICREYSMEAVPFVMDAHICEGRPRPLLSSTAMQIGLKPNENVPPLIPSLLPADAPASSARFLQRWIFTPPTPALAQQMQRLCLSLSSLDVSLPRCSPVPLGKAMALLEKKQANAAFFRGVVLHP